LEAGLEQVGEQLVVTPPAPHLIQRHQEQVGPQRQSGQLQPGHPPLGARGQRRHAGRRQLQAHHVAQQRGRLVGHEAQVALA
jgi:hypothetical protein